LSQPRANSYRAGYRGLAIARRERKRLNRLTPAKGPYKTVARQYVRAEVRVFASYNNRIENVTGGEKGLSALKRRIAGLFDAINKKCLTSVVKFPYYKYIAFGRIPYILKALLMGSYNE
jgi:hypothetical protein